MTNPPFERIVTQHGATVLRVCRAVLGPHEAQDAWSETFLSALRAYPELADGANIQAWLVTIAHRKSIDITRARSRAPVPVESAPEQLSTAGRPEPGDGDVWAEVATLPAKQRQAIAYHYLAGLPHQEVAEIIGGTTDAARRAAADGIKSLRRIYRLSAPVLRSAGSRPVVRSPALPPRTPEPNGQSR